MKQKRAGMLRRAIGESSPQSDVVSSGHLHRPLQLMLTMQFRERVIRGGECLDFDPVGFNVFPPTWEDGILLYIFSILGMLHRRRPSRGANSRAGGRPRQAPHALERSDPVAASLDRRSDPAPNEQ